MSIFAVEHCSFTPSKAVIYNKLYTYSPDAGVLPFRGLGSTLPADNKQKGKISNRSAKRLKDKVNWLVFKSKNQKVKYPNGTISENFRISFITLTLPSQQRHTDLEIKRVFNNFLTTLRKRYNMTDYVWKAELQKNQNIHFHLTTNIFLHHATIRTLWNNCIDRLGYVSAYQSYFSKMTFEKYRSLRLENAKMLNSNIKEEDIVKAYNDGSKNKWSNPNSTDIKTVFNVKNLAAYLAKYLSKKTAKNAEDEEIQKRVKEFGGNIWYCSRSLSRLSSYKTIMCNQYHSFLVKLMNLKNIVVKNYDYCTVIYFDLSKIPKGLAAALTRLLFQYIASPVS